MIIIRKKIDNLYEKNKAEIKKEFIKKNLEIDMGRLETEIDDFY